MVSDVVQETLTARKLRGPPPSGVGTPVTVRLQPEQLAAVDAFAAGEPDKPSRPEAVRRLVAKALQ